MFSSTMFTSVIATLCFSTLSAKAHATPTHKTPDVPPYGRSDMVLPHFERHDIPCVPTSSTDHTSASVHMHQHLVGGCRGTKYGCCGFPISDVPRSTSQDSCATQNCTACIEAVNYIDGMPQYVLNATSHILTYIEDVCADIVGPQAKQCVYITHAAISAIKYVESGMNASAVCNRLGFCRSATATPVVRTA